MNPLTNELIPIITDSSVDPKFGSGCVKITPAHSTSDYEVGMLFELKFFTLKTVT